MANNVFQTRALYEESRQNLCEKISANIHSTGSICRQIVKGSKSGDILSGAAKSFAACDSQIASTEANLKKIGIAIKHFDEQLDTINRTVEDNLPKTF
ncbi:hypothetical protein TYRP_001108 [Tyrophagus putrescentiae]|nr:hypothetical protein TYRP_001108 [Tyrophagus putrescentiae]